MGKSGAENRPEFGRGGRTVSGFDSYEVVNKHRTNANNSYNKSQQDALFLNFILVNNSTFSDRLTVHHQES